MESITILDVSMPTKTIVKKKAEIKDLVIGQTYLMGINGGLSSVKYLGSNGSIFCFDYRGATIRTSLSSVYVI